MTNRLQVCVFAQDGDVIIQIDDERTLLTVRNAEKEEKATVTLKGVQTEVVSDVLQKSALFEDDDL